MSRPLAGLLLHLVCSILLAQHQEIHFELISQNQGLPNQAVTTLIQDHEGCIWIGSNDGLIQYDGYSFRHFRHHPTDSSGPPGNNIRCLAVDKLNRLWIGTAGDGVAILPKQSRDFISAIRNPELANLSQNVQSIAVDYLNRIWVVGEKGLQLISCSEGGLCKIESFSSDRQILDKIQAHRPKIVFADCWKRLWVGCQFGMILFDFKKDSWLFPADGLEPSDIHDINMDPAGKIWISRENTASRVMFFDERDEKFKAFCTPAD